MAYAIFQAGGKQYRVTEGDLIDMDKLDLADGQETTFSEVLFHADGDRLTHGTPSIGGASVVGEIVTQHKAKKVIAFKYRRRKGYHRTVGHRQKLTRIRIKAITVA